MYQRTKLCHIKTLNCTKGHNIYWLLSQRELNVIKQGICTVYLLQPICNDNLPPKTWYNRIGRSVHLFSDRHTRLTPSYKWGCPQSQKFNLSGCLPWSYTFVLQSNGWFSFETKTKISLKCCIKSLSLKNIESVVFTERN